jgi:FkbM family methyltransferase
MATTLHTAKFRARSWMARLGVWRRFESWRLGRRFRRGFIHEPDFQLFRRFDGSGGLFVDVGANVGQSALSFRVANRGCPILSFEPNPEMEFGLRKVKDLLGGGFDYRLHGLGARTETRTLYVPIVRGASFPQLATFNPEGLSDTPDRRRMFRQWTGEDGFEVVERPLRLVRFDEMNLDPEFVKIDVEGTEIDVLAGMEETLRRSRPLIMTEGDSSRDHLARRDYEVYVHDAAANRLVAADRPALNYFFAASEKIPHLERLGVIARGQSRQAAVA